MHPQVRILIELANVAEKAMNDEGKPAEFCLDSVSIDMATMAIQLNRDWTSKQLPSGLLDPVLCSGFKDVAAICIVNY
jgi:hypothetical protein